MASYRSEREQCVARLTKEGLEYWRIEILLRCATTINRLAELACSSEEADRDRVRCPATKLVRKRPIPIRGVCLCADPDADHILGLPQVPTIPRIRLQDWRAEQRAIAAVPDGWQVLTSGDPRGYTLHVVPPSYAERNAGRDRHNLDSIGVPPGPSGLRW